MADWFAGLCNPQKSGGVCVCVIAVFAGGSVQGPRARARRKRASVRLKGLPFLS
jgi:hypothetical protein